MATEIISYFTTMQVKEAKQEIVKGLGSRRGEIGPAIEMHTKLIYVYMVYFIEKNRFFSA